MSQALASDRPPSQKTKDRRFSELSETGSLHTPPDTAGTPPHQLSVITSSETASHRFDQPLAAKTAMLLTNKNSQNSQNSQNSGSQLNSPNTQSPNSLVGSPRAYKKLLLSKVVNETIGSLRTIGESLSEETADSTLDLNSLVGNGYRAIQENVYRCQK